MVGQDCQHSARLTSGERLVRGERLTMDYVSEAINQPLGTLVFIVALCSIGVFAIIHTLGNQILGLLLYPFSISASLCVSKFFIDNHFYSQRSFANGVLYSILSAAIGMGLALIAYIVLSRMLGFVRVTRKPVDLNELRLRRMQLDAPRTP
jgi:hypothetical protein